MFLRLCIYFLLLFFMASPCHDDQMAYSQTGKASFYSNALEGKPTASGELYHGKSFTAAHKTLPFGTIVNVTNLGNDKEVQVRINDRGPFLPNRIIDLSYEAAKALEMTEKGIVKVKIVVVQPAEGYSAADSVASK